MQPIERARADDVTPALHTTLEGAQQCGPTILLVHGFAGSARLVKSRDVVYGVV
jgi:pimeloyl-ACP methyl ester carboxylesterase